MIPVVGSKQSGAAEKSEMFKNLLKKYLAILVSMLLAWSSFVPTLAAAQDIDLEAPIITHTVLVSAPSASVQTISATVKDNNQVNSVVLYYRFSGDTKFLELPMAARESDEYVADIETSPTSGKAIEYFLRASDLAGTFTSRGSAFQPLVRSIVLPLEMSDGLTKSSGKNNSPEIVVEQSTNAASDETKKKHTWLYILGGILLLGAVAGGAGGGGIDTGSTEPCPSNGCSVTLIVSAPQ